MAIRITHAIGEIIRNGNPKTRITHTIGEIIRNGNPKARITHAIGEIIRNQTAESSAQPSSMFFVFS